MFDCIKSASKVPTKEPTEMAEPFEPAKILSGLYPYFSARERQTRELNAHGIFFVYTLPSPVLTGFPAVTVCLFLLH